MDAADSPRRRLPGLVDDAPRPPAHHCLDVSVDWFRYTHRALCVDLIHHDQINFVLPLGAQTMLCLLRNTTLPQTEVDEYDDRNPTPAAPPTAQLSLPSNIFAFGPVVRSKQHHIAPRNSPQHDRDATKMAALVANDLSYYLYLVVRTLVCLVHGARGLERRRLLSEGAAHVLAVVAAPLPPNQANSVMNGLPAIRRTQHRYPPHLARLLDLSSIQRMARAGLASISMDELRRVSATPSSQLTSSLGECRASVDAVIAHRLDALERHRADVRRRQAADACFRNPANLYEARLGSATALASATKTLHERHRGNHMTKAQVVQWTRRADAVTRHLLHSLAVLHEAAAMESHKQSSLKQWLAQKDQERMTAAAAATVVARQRRELELMTREDKPPETEVDRRARLQAKAQQLAQWEAETRIANAAQVRRVLEAKAEHLARLTMTHEDRYIPRAVHTAQELEAAAVAAEAARVAALRVQVRERVVREVEERLMREEDALARQVRRHLWDQEEASFRRQRGQEAAEARQMRQEDVHMHNLWPLIDAADEERQFQAKLAKKKADRAAARRQRRLIEHPELYAKEWEAVDDGSARYFRNIVTGDVQWTNPCVTPSWNPVVDDQGRTYYVHSTTGESVWTLPTEPHEHAWDEFYTDDGIVYYVHRTTGESVWKIPGEWSP
ncbi:hypothetical protein DYB32_007553 [Aphanomyces invadans]|uniref:WW domain-containing protein n=1 Tax=Aphanomyces invadans TaxID=157072 RepID=A0A3R6V6X3_9STRA|nr:hypothetical protein DYB32_007553 [Aphanomyces invadans]